MSNYGQLTTLGISFQDSYGVFTEAGSYPNVVADSYHFVEFTSEDIGLEIPPLLDESMRGVFDEGDSYAGARMISGTLAVNALPLAMGVLFKAMFGAPTTVTSAGYYTHTFKPRTADFDGKCAGTPFSIQKNMGVTSADIFADLNMTTLELGITQGQLMRATATIVGGTFGRRSAAAASFDTGKRFTWDQSSISISGSANDEVTEATITIEESIEAQHTLSGKVFASRTKRTGFRMVTVGGTIRFENRTEYEAFAAQSERPMVITLTGATEVQSGYKEIIEIDMPAFRYEEFKPSAGGPGPIEVGFSGKAKYHVGSGTAVQITLANTQAAY